MQCADDGDDRGDEPRASRPRERLIKNGGREGQNVAAEYAKRITAAWLKSVESILETGRLLVEAKAALDHGQWLKMFSGMFERGNVPFGVRTAQMLMAIAEHPVIGNP